MSESAEQAFSDTANNDGGAVATSQPLAQANETQQQTITQDKAQAAQEAPPVAKPNPWEAERKQLQDQWDAERKELQRRADQANGKFGETKRRLDQLEAEKRQAAEAESKRESEANAQTWADFEATFPEFAVPMAARTAELEARIASLMEQRDQSPKETQEQQSPEALAKTIERQVALKIYTQMHPDANQHAWTDNENGQQVQRYSPDMQAWLNTISADERKNTTESEDPIFVSGQLTKFKAWLSQKDAATKESKVRSQNRMKAAIMPQSSQPALHGVLTAEEAFNQAAMA